MKEEMQVSGIHAHVERATVWILDVQQGLLGVMRQNWEVVIGGSGHRWLAFSAMLSPLLAGPKVTGLTKWGLKPPKPWAHLTSWLLLVILTQQWKGHENSGPSPSAWHTGMAWPFWEPRLPFFFSETYKMIPKSIWRFGGLVLSQAKATLKDSIGEHRFPNFKTLCEAAVAKTVKQIDQRNRRAEARLGAEKSNNLWWQCWTTGQTHEKKNRLRPGPHPT